MRAYLYLKRVRKNQARGTSVRVQIGGETASIFTREKKRSYIDNRPGLAVVCCRKQADLRPNFSSYMYGRFFQIKHYLNKRNKRRIITYVLLTVMVYNNQWFETIFSKFRKWISPLTASNPPRLARTVGITHRNEPRVNSTYQIGAGTLQTVPRANNNIAPLCSHFW